MIKRQLISMMACSLLLLAATSTSASPHQAQSELVQKSLFYQRVITPPQGTSFAQRTLLAVNAAATELRMYDPVQLHEAYEAALATDNLQPISDTTWSWIVDHWEFATRTTFTYDGNGRLLETLSEQWDGNLWQLHARITVHYDGNGRQDTVTTQFRAADEWENAARMIFVYDGGSFESEMINQNWNVPGSMWVNVSRSTYTYASDLVDTRTSYLWDTDHWSLSSVITYTYNGQGQQTEALTQADLGGGLTNAYRTTDVYDSNGNDTLTVNENWGGSLWLASARVRRMFDGNNNEILTINDTWFGTMYMTVSNDTSKYNPDNRVAEVVHVELLFSSDLSRTLYYYDDANMTVTTVDQTWNPALQAAPAAAWENDLKTITVYQEYATSVQLDANPHSPRYELSQNFPNPFNPTTVIHFSLPRGADVNISIYNLLGQHVTTLENGYHDPGVYETTWDGTDAAGRAVPSGVYFYRLRAGPQTETRKMLLLK